MRDYLMQAYTQQHPTSVDEWMKQVRSLLDSGTLVDLHQYMSNKYGCPKLGTSRVAYIGKICVFKVPITDSGFRANDWETSLVSTAPEDSPYYIPLARTRYFKHDIPIVCMERVEEANFDDIEKRLGHIPDFVSAVDMGQVGWTRKGKLVAFDYADL